eukprot:m51a1_g11327 hypothetical protein (230) ;mRNA; r:128594-129469
MGWEVRIFFDPRCGFDIWPWVSHVGVATPRQLMTASVKEYYMPLAPHFCWKISTGILEVWRCCLVSEETSGQMWHTDVSLALGKPDRGLTREWLAGEICARLEETGQFTTTHSVGATMLTQLAAQPENLMEALYAVQVRRKQLVLPRDQPGSRLFGGDVTTIEQSDIVVSGPPSIPLQQMAFRTICAKGSEVVNLGATMCELARAGIQFWSMSYPEFLMRLTTCAVGHD